MLNGMDTILSPFYNSTAKPWEKLLEDLAIEEGPDKIDILISTTCGEMLYAHGASMAKLLESRVDPFRLVCVQHHVDRGELQRMHPMMQLWAERHKLSFIGLSAQSVS